MSGVADGPAADSGEVPVGTDGRLAEPTRAEQPTEVDPTRHAVVLERGDAVAQSGSGVRSVADDLRRAVEIRVVRVEEQRGVVRLEIS
ncbi:MAG: hypothetical protein ABEI99_07320 [Halobaculum sp.]